MTVGIVGLGLLGGSFAKAYTQAAHTVFAGDRDENVLGIAKIGGFIAGELTGENLAACEEAYRAAQSYGEEQLAELSCRELVTFHDGFAYFADAFGLTVAASMEIESGSEPSARELAEVAELVRGHAIPVVFAEKNGDDSAARTVASETGAAVRLLDLGMGSDGISPAQVIRNNIDTVKEALG